MYSIKTLVKPCKNPHKFLQKTPFLHSLTIPFTTQIPNSHFSPKPTTNGAFEPQNKRPLDVLFKEALGLSENGEVMRSLSEANGELMRNLLELEMEVRQLKASSGDQGKELALEDRSVSSSSSRPKRLLDVFEGGQEKEVVFKELSEDMQVLLKHLYDEGYFKNANCVPQDRFDVSCFYEEYAREFVKSALDRFGKDHREIAKWISGSDVKTVALFGCPTLLKRDVFAAKKLRLFFKIEEETVCRKCVLKESCKFVNQSVWKGENTLRVDSLLRLLRAYSLEEIPPELKLTDDVKASVSRLIHEIMNLSKNNEAASSGSIELANR